MPSPQTQAEALVALTWNQGSVILSDSAKKHRNSCDALVFYLVPRTGIEPVRRSLSEGF